MTSATATKLPRFDEGPRGALLLWGGGLLVAGLAMVGVGAGAEGAPLALAGLFNTLYGIHAFGRLGPDDQAGGDEAQARASTTAWTGGLTALAGLIVVVDHQGGAGDLKPWALTAYGLCVVGVARLARGRRDAQRAQRDAGAAEEEEGAGGSRKRPAGARRGDAKVEKRRRMDKGAAP